MPAPPLRSTFGSLVTQTARLWRRAVNKGLQPYGLTEATWLPLLRVARAGRPLRQKELAAALGLDGSSLVRLLDNLQAAGLIERHEEAADRRAKAIHLTEAGRAIVAQVESVATEVRARLLAGIADAELAQAAGVLQRILDELGSADDASEEGA